MTVSSSNADTRYAGDGSSTVFATGFSFYATSTLRVSTVVNSTGVETVKTIGADYSVTGGVGSTGSITFVTAPASGTTVVIKREEPYEQGTDLGPNDPLPAEVLELQFDKLAMQIQQVNRRALSAIQAYPGFDPNSQDPLTLPVPTEGKALIGRSDGTGWDNGDFENLPVSDVPVLITTPKDKEVLRYDLGNSRWINDVPQAFSVSTLAALKALLLRPPIVIVQGKISSSDGWGGTFYWVNGNTDIADDALIVQPAAGVSGRWKRLVPNNLYKAEWFGYIADGATDNSTALQAAITAATAANGGVLLPGGVAKLGTTINLTDICSLIAATPNTVFKPVNDGIGTMFNITGGRTSFQGFKIDGSAIGSPTFTAIKIDTTSGLNKLHDLEIVGAGIGLYIPACNAGRITHLRIQQCVTCIQTGGVNGSYPGDLTWDEIVCIPTTAGTAWIIDGNTNAQYMHRVQTIGGAVGLYIRGAGASTSLPDGIFMSDGNLTAASGNIVTITKGRNVRFDDTIIGGSTGAHGVQINAVANADVDGVVFESCQIRANYKRGISFEGGANVKMDGGECYGNSDGGGSGTYSNIYVGASAVGLFSMVGVMAGLSASGEVYANIAGPAKYGVELASGALTDATNFPGRLILVGNVFDGNTTGDISDASAPTGHRKVKANNMLAL